MPCCWLRAHSTRDPFHHYLLDIGAVDFESALPDGVSSRLATEDDLDDLAHLMLEAYRGTIDYDGEGIEEAVAEVRGYFAGSPIADCSVLLLVDGRVASACLVGDYDNGAIVGYVMTTPAEKRRGLGTAATVESLAALQAAGYRNVHAWITEGNVASERIFVDLEFAMVS